MTTEARQSSRRQDPRNLGLDIGLPLATGLLIFAGHLLYGALITDVALLIGLGIALLVAAVLIVPGYRSSLTQTPGLVAPGVAFGISTAVALITLTPWIKAAVHPVWAYVGKGAAAITVDKSSTLVEVIKLGVLACVFMLGLTAGASSKRARSALLILLSLGVAFALWAMLGAATGLISGTQKGRLEGYFLNPNTAGTLFAVFLTLAVGALVQTWRESRPGGRAIKVGALGGSTLIFLFALLMTASRGAVIAAVIGLLFFGLTQLISGRRGLSRGAIISLVAALVCGLALVFAGNFLVDRFIRLEDSAQLRASIWEPHWKAFQAAPVFGYGLGSSETVNRTLITAANFAELWDIRAVLSVYLQWLEQAGVAGAAPMFAALVVIVAGTFARTVRQSRGRVWLFALLAADIVFIVHGVSDFALETPSMAMLWAYLLGLQFSLSIIENRDKRRGSPSLAPIGALLCGAVTFGSGLVLAALWLGGAVPLGPLGKFEIAAGYDRRAQGLLDQRAPSAKDRAQAAAASRLALTLYPYDTAASLRLAVALAQPDGGLPPAALQALQRSYDLVEIDPQFANARIQILLNHWEALTPDLRLAARKEFTVLYSQWTHKGLAEKNIAAVANPAGQLAGRLWIAQQKRQALSNPSQTLNN